MATMTDIARRERTAREIARTRESIRRKHKALKTGKMESEMALEQRYQPIVEPLKRIAESAERKREETAFEKAAPQQFAYIAEKRKHEKSEEDDDDDSRRAPLKAKRRRRSRATSNASFFASTPKRTDLAIDGGRRRLRTEEDVDENMEVEDEVFETDELPPLETKPTLSTSQDLEAFLSQLGPLGQRYLRALSSGDTEIDHVYGAYFVNPQTTMLGDKDLVVAADDSIVIDGVRYAGTPGLYALIFKDKPEEREYTANDLKTYGNILLTTNAFRRGHSGQVLGSKGYKYKNIIAPLLAQRKAPSTARKAPSTVKKGAGSVPRAMRVTDDKIDYVHWDDPNELVDRLRLLLASRQAGNNAHENEILSIIEELREAGLIIN